MAKKRPKMYARIPSAVHKNVLRRTQKCTQVYTKMYTILLLLFVLLICLFQAGKGFLDAAHRFHDILVACSITHAETFGRTKGISAYSRYMTNFQ